jgi:alpha-ketoglutarate-dependent taurine dioxygenase
MLMRDNRSSLHRRDEFSPENRWLMHRTQVKNKAAPRAA